MPLGLTAFDALDPYEFEDPGSDSAESLDALEDVTGVRADGTMIGLVEGPARTDRGTARVVEVGEQLAEVDGIESVLDPWGPPQPAWIAEDGQSAFVLGFVDADADSTDVAPAAEERFAGADDVELGGVVMADDQIANQAEEDLRRAEMLAFPLLLLLSLLFFRSLVAAALPLVIGGIAIVGALATMRAIHEVAPLSVLAINVVTGLGLGLAIDYSLFVLARYREELAQRAEHRPTPWPAPFPPRAGRSPSARSPWLSRWRCLLVFPQQFLYSVAISGMAIAVLCGLVALVVLPAMLSLLGDRVNALAPAWLQRSAKATDLPDRRAAGTGSRAW